MAIGHESRVNRVLANVLELNDGLFVVLTEDLHVVPGDGWLIAEIRVFCDICDAGNHSKLQGSDTSIDRKALVDFLRRQRYGVVSSVAANGAPQSALVGIATTAELEIVFDTLSTTRKYANLQARPSCAFAIGWSGEQTVQLEGEAIFPHGAELERYREIYFEAWPDGRDRLHWKGITHIVVQPRWIRYSDFDRDPPLIVEGNGREFRIP
jgi:hypothetical protein